MNEMASIDNMIETSEGVE